MTCNRVYLVFSAHDTGSPVTLSYFEEIERVHEGVLLLLCQYKFRPALAGRICTAIPAKAPAAMFSTRVKFGGSPS